MGTAELIFTGGVVYTVDAARSVAEAVAVQAGRIVCVGSAAEALEWRGPHTEVVDLRGRMLLPGFCDAHAHASAAVGELYSAQLFHLPSVAECTAAVQRFAARYPELPVITGEGWNNTIAPRLGPHRRDLDAVESDRPVVLTSEDYHSVWCNSRALQAAGITEHTPAPPGGVIERDPDTGAPSGTLRENALDLVAGVIPDHTPQQYRAGIEHYQEHIAAPAGITLVFDPLLPHVGQSPGECAAARAYADLAEAGALRLRVRAGLTLTPDDDPHAWLAEACSLRDSLRHPLFEITAVKVFEDGVIEGHTAYLKDDYADAPGDRGDPLWGSHALSQAAAAIDAAGLDLHAHCIGDAATAAVLDAIESVERPRQDRRATITHLQFVDPVDVPRLAATHTVAALQPFWFVQGVDYRLLEVPFVGAERAAAEYPCRSLLDAGVVVAGASDFPVSKPCDPLVGMQGAVARWLPSLSDGDAVLGPAERMTVEQAIAAFTVGGAYAHRSEHVTGSIEVGKSADLVVLDRDLRHSDPRAIAEAKVLMTVFSGRVVFAAADARL